MSNVLISTFSFLLFLVIAEVLWEIKGIPTLGEAFATSCIACALSVVAFIWSVAALPDPPASSSTPNALASSEGLPTDSVPFQGGRD